MERVSKNQIIWGGNYFSLSPSRCWICWDKKQPWDNFSQIELAWTSFDGPSKIYRLSNRGGSNDETKIHPIQKPVSLYRQVLKDFAKIEDKILDTHGGSFSSRIACKELGFDFYGWELDEKYFTDSQKRFETMTIQQKIFHPRESLGNQLSL